MATSSGTVCAIVPTFNRSAMLRECLDSLLTQTHPIHQIIVVNDGSTDDTEQVAKSYGEQITYLSKSNAGKAAALNFALGHCKSDYVWICDDDDVAAPAGLKALVDALDANEDAGLAFGDYQLFEDRVTGRAFFSPGLLEHPGETNINLLFLEQMITCQFAMLVKRPLYDKVGPFREELIRSQDYDMILRLINSAPSVRLSDIIFFQRQHSGVRGSEELGFAATSKELKWVEYDRKIFSVIRANYPIEGFVPSFARNWTPLMMRRASLIERGCIFARRSMWPEAASDFREAQAVCKEPLTNEEKRLIETLISIEFSWKILMTDPKSIADLRAIYDSSAVGKEIVSSVSRSLVWYGRQKIENKQIGPALQIGYLMIALLGIAGTVSRIFKSLKK